MAKRLSHVDSRGRVRMVPVGGKRVTRRAARAEATLIVQPATLRAIAGNRVAKGNVLEVARIAGIQAAKDTPGLIPLCHPVRLTHADVQFDLIPPREIRIRSSAEASDRTGVEMEALAAAAAAALTVYDMVKAIDRGMEIRSIVLMEKKGGRSGHYRRESK